MTSTEQWGGSPDAAVARAMEALEALLAASRDSRLSAQSRTYLLAAGLRVLTDPKAGYLRRLRVQRSALLRERVRDGATMAQLAVELGVTPDRVRALLNDNQLYRSASRALAIAEGKAFRAARAVAARAARQQAAADRFSARVEEGRALAARIAGGSNRAELMEETGYTRNRIVGLLSDAARADDEGQA